MFVKVLRGMFGWDDFEKDGKKRVENRWEGCLVGRGWGEKNWWDSTAFSLSSSKLDPPKMEWKYEGK